MTGIKKAISLLVEQNTKGLKGLTFEVGKVTSVDFEKCSCEVKTLNDIIIYNVNLRSVIDGSDEGFVIFPKADSLILIGKIGNENNAFVAMFSKITDVWIDANVVFNGGDNKGLVKLPELVDQLNKVENKLNDLIAWTSTHTHTGVTAGGSTSGTAVGVTGTITPTTEADLENTKVKQ